MAQIRPETEVDRTAHAIAGYQLALPLARGSVELVVGVGIASTPGGQRLLSLLLNVLARMKGVVSSISVVADELHVRTLPGTPLLRDRVDEGLVALANSLNDGASEYLARLELRAREDPDVRVHIGEVNGSTADIVVGADAWRALFGHAASAADWTVACPVGAALAAAMTAAEVFKRLLRANGAGDDVRLAPSDFAYSAFNYGVDEQALEGPDVPSVHLSDLAIVGCGAGGSGTAYVLAMHPTISGEISLIEPGNHKLSNLNRYLATTAADVHEPRHKLSSLVNHLAHVAPALQLSLKPRPWEQLDEYPWSFLISAVDTIEARWNIQWRAREDVTIIDLAVDDLLYNVMRLSPQGRCLLCKHPYDPKLAVKQRALRWGVGLDTVETWQSENTVVNQEMITGLARTQGRSVDAFNTLVGMPFRDTPQLLECGSTPLRTDVPSQMPILPLATTAVAVAGAAEVIKHIAQLPTLDNHLAHDLRRNPTGPWCKHRRARPDCSNHATEK